MAFENEKILEVKDLRISFKTLSGTVKAVRGINFDLYKGRTLAIVGESGSGKSVTSRAILGILANNKIVEGGQILYDGKDLLQLSEDQFTSIRGSKISMIFQDPLSSLNPIMRVGKQLTEPMFLKAKATRKEARKTYKSYLKVLKSELSSSLDYVSFAKDLKEFSKIESLVAKIEDKKLKLAKVQDEVKKQQLNQQLEELNSLKEKVYETIKVFFEDQTNTSLIKASLLSKYEQYIENIKELQRILKEFKEKHFITSFDYISKIHELEKQISSLFDDYSLNVKELNENILKEQEKLDNLKLNGEQVDKTTLNSLYNNKKTLKLTLQENLKNVRESIYKVLDFNPKEVIKDLKNIQKVISNCDYAYAIEKDDIVTVFATSLFRYIDGYLESIKLNKEDVIFKDKYFNFDTGEKVDIPAKIRAKRRETIVPFYEFYSTMIKSIDNIVSYIEEALLSHKFDVDSFYVAFISSLKKQCSLAATRVKKSQAKAKALQLLQEVGIPEPERRFYQYPFEFSGGMRQRIVIAIALSSNPEVLICDEPTTALDVTIQAQILELINKMKKEHNLSIIFITHDLGVVANMADDIAVMYAGKIVEYGSVYDIFYDPRHPYTWALLGSMPDLDTKEKLEAIPGTPPNMLLPPKGDAFAARNKFAMKIDYEMQPPFFSVSPTHFAATWLLHEKAPSVKAPKVVEERILNSLKKDSTNRPVYTNDKNSILKGGN